MKTMRVAGILAAMTTGGAALGDFSGPYAPEHWTFTPGISGMLLEHTADVLIFQNYGLGSDVTTDITVVAAATGEWTFHWHFIGDNSGFFDQAYYLVNGAATFLADGYAGGFGDAEVNVQAGDIIGFRIDSAAPVFFPAKLTITNFSAPVPSPAAACLLLGICARRRRRRFSSSAGHGPPVAAFRSR